MENTALRENTQMQGLLKLASFRHNDVDKDIATLNLLMADPSITDIMINGPDRVFIEKNGRMQDAEFTFDSSEAVMSLALALVAMCGKTRVAEVSPIIDGALPDGSRLTVLLPPAVLDGASISIRKFPEHVFTLEELKNRKFLSESLMDFLAAATRARVNMIIAGNTSSGKTTLLNALSAYIGATERVVTIEDTPELQIQQRNVVRMVTQGIAHIEGPDDLTVRDLVRSALRIRPDRMILGEIRGVETFDVLQMINTGHNGCMSTVHANSPRETLLRLEHLVNLSQPELAQKYIRPQIASAVNLIIQTQRDERGLRRITHVTELVGMEGEIILLQDLFVSRGPKEAGDYLWTNVSSRNPQVQKAIRQAKLID